MEGSATSPPRGPQSHYANHIIIQRTILGPTIYFRQSMVGARKARKTAFSQFPRNYHQAEKESYAAAKLRPAAMVAVAAVLRLATRSEEDPYLRLHFEFKSKEVLDTYFGTSFLFALPHPLYRAMASPTLLVVPRQDVERVQSLTHFPHCTVVSRANLASPAAKKTLSLPPAKRLVLVDQSLPDKLPPRILRAAWAVVSLQPSKPGVSMRERVRRAAAASALLPNSSVRVGIVPRTPTVTDRKGESESESDHDSGSEYSDSDSEGCAAAPLLTFGSAEAAAGEAGEGASTFTDLQKVKYAPTKRARRGADAAERLAVRRRGSKIVREVVPEAQFGGHVRRIATNIVAVLKQVRSRLGAAWCDVARVSVSAHGGVAVPLVTVGATAVESNALNAVEELLRAGEGRSGHATRATHGGTVLSKRVVGAVDVSEAAARAGVDVDALRSAAAAARGVVAAQASFGGGGGLANDDVVARGAGRVVRGRAEALLAAAVAKEEAARRAAEARRGVKVGRSVRKARVREEVDAVVSGLARGARGRSRVGGVDSGASHDDASGDVGSTGAPLAKRRMGGGSAFVVPL